MIKIAIFASGAGSNAQKIIDHFRHHTAVKVGLIGCNKPGAGVVQIAAAENIPLLSIDKEVFFRGNAYVDELKKEGIGWIILAGFLWLIPTNILAAFPGRIINIHPALLPAYGGKGMYGMKVHQAVIAAGDAESGITIHHVNEHYDEGDIIFQARCTIATDDTPELLASKIHELEYEHFPRVIQDLVAGVK